MGTALKTVNKTHSTQPMNLTLPSKILYGVSLLMIVATGILLNLYGKTTYFALFHHPLHLSVLTASKQAYIAPSLPSFHVQSVLSSKQLVAGDSETIQVHATSNMDTVGYLEVWIYSPKHKEIYKSPMAAAPQLFKKDMSYNFTYSYEIPVTIPAGIYSVSDLITSKDTNTDYFVNENFASFTVQ